MKEKSQSRKETTKQLLQLLQPMQWAMLGAIILSVATMLSNMGLLAVSAVLISLAALQPPILDLMVYIVAVRFFGISRACFRYGERYFSHDITLRILSKLRGDIYRRIEPKTPESLQGYGTGDLYAGLVADLEVLQYFYLRAVIAPCAAGLIWIIGCFVVYGFLPKLALVFTMCFMVFGVIFPWVSCHQMKCAIANTKQWELQWQTQLIDYSVGMDDLVHCGQSASYRKNMLQTLHELDVCKRKTEIIQIMTTHCIQFGSYLAMGLTAWIGYDAICVGQLSPIYYAMLLLFLWASFEAITPLPDAFRHWNASMEAAQHMFMISKEEWIDREETGSVCNGYDIDFSHVDFAYDKNGPMILQDVSLQFPQGSHTVILGESGVGKSTMIQLLLHFWKPTQGEIRIGGQSINTLSEEQLRNSIGYVQQQPYLFHATLEENLRLAKDDLTKEALNNALEFAELKYLCDSLPEGIQTMLGENGYNLSGGERQRVALAELYLQNHPILILDEAFHSMDRAYGVILRNRLLKWAKSTGKTIIEITHSEEDAESADYIFVLKNGKCMQKTEIE